MTEQEAITVLSEQFMTPGGFLGHLQRGEGLDRERIWDVWDALDALQQVWAPRSCVPREAVLALTYIDEALPRTFDQNPADLDELMELHFELIRRVEATFHPLPPPEDERSSSVAERAPVNWDRLPPDFFWWEDWSDQTVVPDRPLTEAEALAVLRQHLHGEHGLVVALRCDWGAGNKLGVAKAWLLLHRALEALQPRWAERPCIPKDIASGLAQIRGWIINGWIRYDDFPTLQQALLDIANDLGAQVQRCLQERKPGTRPE